MKKIIMNNESKIDLLQKELDIVQNKCTSRILTAKDIVRILDKVENEINIPKKYLKGSTIIYTAAQEFAKSYKQNPKSTHFYAEYNGSAWVITNIIRDDCPRTLTNKNVDVTLSEQAKEAIINKYNKLHV